MAFDLSQYEPVEDRIIAFWSEHPQGRITTEMTHVGADGYIVKASVWRERNGIARIGDVEAVDPPDATGYAQEAVTQSGVNKTSALENCETSAIGRALANLGYAAKGKRPSREEMQKVSSDLEPARGGANSQPDGMGEDGGPSTNYTGGDGPIRGGSAAYGEGAAGSPASRGAATPSGPSSAPAADDTAALRGTEGGDTVAPSAEPVSPPSPEDEQRAAYIEALRAGPGLPQAFLQAKALFNTDANKRVRNMRDFHALSLDELFQVLQAFEERKAVSA